MRPMHRLPSGTLDCQRPARPLSLAPRALVPTQPKYRRRVENAQPVDIDRLRSLVKKYRKTHPYVPPPPLELPLLERTDALLSDYCGTLPSGSEERERCQTALQYYEARRRDAEGACDVKVEDGRVVEAGCETQHRLEDFVRNMVGAAPMEDFVQTLLVLQRAEEHDAAQAASGAVSDEGTAEEALRQEQRERLTRLFYALDSDLNGKLDIAEFREGMHQAGQEMSGPAVAQVLDAMGVQKGFLELEEFLAIAEVEERAARTALAQWIRVKSASDRP